MEIKFDFSRVLKNTFFLICSSILSKLFTLVFIVFAVRSLGVKEFGIYALVLSLISIFTVISDFGFYTLIVRDVSQDKSLSSKYLTHVLFLKIFFVILSYAGLYFLAYFLNYSLDVRIILMIAGIGLIADSLRNTLNAFFFVYQRIDMLSRLNALYSLINSIFGILILVSGYGLKGLFLGIASVNWLFLIITLFVILKNFTFLERKVEFIFLQHLIKQVFPFAFLTILSIVYFKMDTVMLSVFKDELTVGYYNAPYKLIEILMFIPVTFSAVLFPVVSSFSILSKKALSESYKWALKILTIIVFPIVMSCTILNKQIIEYLLGENYLVSGPVFVVLIWALLFIFINASAGNIIYNSTYLRSFIYFSTANTFLNLLLNVIFIPKYSFMGAGMVTLLTEITGMAINIYFLKKILFEFPSFREIFVKPVTAVLLMGIIILISKGLISNIYILILIIIASFAFYGWLLLRMKIISNDEKASIRNLFMKVN
ncbi:MAG: flippase [bacterium]|nr:flippase [bacterium]